MSAGHLSMWLYFSASVLLAALLSAALGYSVSAGSIIDPLYWSGVTLLLHRYVWSRL